MKLINPIHTIGCLLLLGCCLAPGQEAINVNVRTVTNTAVVVDPIRLTAEQMDSIISVIRQLGISANVPINSTNLASVTLSRGVLVQPLYSTNQVPQVSLVVDTPAYSGVLTNANGSTRLTNAPAIYHWETNQVPQVSVSYSNAVVFNISIQVQ